MQERPEGAAGWVDYLGRRLDAQAQAARRWDGYYRGDQAVSFVGPKYRAAFAKLLAGFADNFCGLIVDSVAERLQVTGFRMSDDPNADKDAWAFWQASNMDAGSGLAISEALISERAFVSVWGDQDGRPVIQPESPREVAVARDAQRRPVAALKRHVDEWGTEFASLFTAAEVAQLSRRTGSTQWSDDVRSPNPLGVVPFVELPNKPRLGGAPSSELMVVAPIQDALNKVMRDALLASEFAAYPQRWVTGMETETDASGASKPPPFDAALDRIFAAADPDTRFGQFAAADLSNYARLAELLVQHMASVSRVPFHYFLINGGQAPSGEAITSAEAGLVAKARDRQLHFGEAWEQVIRLAFRVTGDARADSPAAETIWRDPEYRSQAQRVDALLKMQTLGVPAKQLWEDAGYSPQQTARFEVMRAGDALLFGQQEAVPGGAA